MHNMTLQNETIKSPDECQFHLKKVELFDNKHLAVESCLNVMGFEKEKTQISLKVYLEGTGEV